LIQSHTGGFALIVADVGTVGNQAAADFISDPASLAKLLTNAPAAWEHMNMQAVLRANKINDIRSLLKYRLSISGRGLSAISVRYCTPGVHISFQTI
jgi:hypothetical protein